MNKIEKLQLDIDNIVTETLVDSEYLVFQDTTLVNKEDLEEMKMNIEAYVRSNIDNWVKVD